MSKTGKRKRALRAAAYVAAALALLLLLAVAALWWALRTDTGRQWTARRISSLASSQDLKLDIQGLDGALPGRISVAAFTLADRDGAWLTGRGLTVGWSWRELLTGRVHLTDVRLELLEFQRPPASSEDSEPLDLSTLSLPRIAVDRLVIQETRVSAFDPKAPAVFHVEGYLAADVDRFDLNLRVTRPAIQKDRLNLAASWERATGILTVDGEVLESPGGLLPGLAGGGAVRASLKGRGPLADWTGRLTAKVDTLGQIATDLRLGVGRETSFGLEGTFALDPAGPTAGIASRAGANGGFQVSGRMGEDGAVHLEKLALENENLTVSAAGRLVPDGSAVALNFRAEAKNPAALLAGTGLETASASLSGRLEGSFSQPVLNVQAALGHTAWLDYRAASASLQAALRKTGDGLQCTAQASLQDAITPHTQGPTNLAVSLDGVLESGSTLRFSRINVQGWGMAIKAAGHYGVGDGSFETTGRAEVEDLASLAPVADAGMNGRGGLDFKLAGNAKTPSVHAGIVGQIEALSGLPEPARPLVGEAARIEADARYEKNVLTLTRARVEARTTVEASGLIRPEDRSMDVKWSAVIPTADKMAASYGVALSGPVKVSGQVIGSFDNFTLRVSSEAERAGYSGRELSGITVTGELTGLPGRLQGQAGVSGRFMGGPAQASTGFDYLDGRLRLHGLKASVLGASASCDLTLDTASLLATGRVRVNAPNLAALSALAGANLGGSAVLEADLSTAGGRQGLSGSLTASNLRYAGVAVSSLQAKIDRLALSGGSPSGSLTLTASGLRSGKTAIDSVRVSVNGSLERGSFQAEAKSAAQGPRLSAAGGYARTRGATEVTLQTASGAMEGVNFRLNRPASILLGAGGWRVRGLDATLGGGRVRGDAEISSGRASADLTAEGLPLELLPINGPMKIKGRAGGRIQVSGAASSPRLKAELSLKKLLPQGPGIGRMPGLDVDVTLTAENGRLHARADISGLSKKPGRAEVDLPFRFSLSPFQASLPAGGALKGSFKTGVSLALVPVFLGLDDQLAGGRADIDLTLSGSAGRPIVAGAVDIEAARYENLALGLVLDNINARLTGDESRLQLERFEADAGQGGRVTASGGIDLAPEKGRPYEWRLDLDKALVIGLDLVTARVSGGVALRGDMSGGQLVGVLDVDEAEMRLPKSLPSSITEVEVREINTGRDQEAAPTGQKEKPFRLALAMTVRAAGQVHVRGRGLDSEWKGNLKLAGAAGQPVITGKLELVRGKFDFPGRPFDLTEGLIRFTGASPPEPWLNVQGETQVDDAKIVLGLSGPVKSPDLELSSVPALPRDELLSRVLFGRSAADISPLQALRLAAAVNDLSGSSGPDLDVLGRLREILTLDSADLKQGEEGGVTVGVGKYVHDRVYVEAEKGQDPAEDRVRVEIELTPELSLESEAGADAKSGVRLKWQHDY